MCYLAQNPQKEESLENERGLYMLPDGSQIEIGKARFRAPEVLFRPDLIGEECEGLHEVGLDLIFEFEILKLLLSSGLRQNNVLKFAFFRSWLILFSSRTWTLEKCCSPMLCSLVVLRYLKVCNFSLSTLFTYTPFTISCSTIRIRPATQMVTRL